MLKNPLNVDEKFLDDTELMTSSVHCDYTIFLSASKRLQTNLEFVIKAGLSNPKIANYLVKAMQTSLLSYLEKHKCKKDEEEAVLLLKNTLSNILRLSPTKLDTQKPSSSSKNRTISFSSPKDKL